jgi:hypothetical protein
MFRTSSVAYTCIILSLYLDNDYNLYAISSEQWAQLNFKLLKKGKMMGLWNAGESDAYVLTKSALTGKRKKVKLPLMLVKWLYSLSTVTIVDILKWTLILVGK